jgi:hypothetical protein
MTKFLPMFQKIKDFIKILLFPDVSRVGRGDRVQAGARKKTSHQGNVVAPTKRYFFQIKLKKKL